jgi:hypothetical protein
MASATLTKHQLVSIMDIQQYEFCDQFQVNMHVASSEVTNKEDDQS